MAPREGGAPVLQDDSSQRALICPESGRLLLRYRVGHGLRFHIDRSPATGGVWLDKGEWEALKSKGLHVSLHLIFTAAYQRQIRSAEYVQKTDGDVPGPGLARRIFEGDGVWSLARPSPEASGHLLLPAGYLEPSPSRRGTECWLRWRCASKGGLRVGRSSIA